MGDTWIAQVLGSVPPEAYFAGAFLVVMIGFATGRIVFRREVVDVRKDRDDRLAETRDFYATRETEREAHKDEMIQEISGERDLLRRSGQIKDETIATLLSQNAEFKELARTGVQLLNALPQPAPRQVMGNTPEQSGPPAEEAPSNG